MPTFPGPLELKNAMTEDIDDILDVYRRCEDFLALGPHPEASPAMVTKDLEDVCKAGGVFKSIYTGSILIGVVSYVAKGFKGRLSDACIFLLMIIPSFRKKGIGARIVEMVEKEIFSDAKVTSILLGVQVNNPRALKFWRNKGYRVTSGPEAMPDDTVVFHLSKTVKTVI